MAYFITKEIVYFPIDTESFYRVFNDEREEPPIKTLELIDERKNVYGDTIYYIRDEKGATATVFEQDVEEYLRKKGVSSLMKGHSFIYRK